jgi:DNA-binding transcriptional LysR family regulator
MKNDGRIELRHLRAFVAVADELHFRRAAARMGVAQAALSQHLRQLEEALGAAVLRRTTRRVELTAVGEVFLHHARNVLDQASRGVAAARSTARGELGVLRLGFAPSASIAILPAVLRSLGQHLPDVAVELYEQPLVAPLHAVETDQLDLAIVRGPADHPGLTAVPLLEEALVVVVPAGHPLAREAEVTPGMLRDEPVVLFRRAGAPELHDFITRLCGDAGFSLRVVREATEWAMIASLVAAGFGITIAPESAREAVIGAVAARRIAGSQGAAKLAVVHRSRVLAPPVQAALEVLVRAARSGRLGTM